MTEIQERPLELQRTPALTFSVWLAGILRRRRLILKFVAALVALAILAAVLLPPIYRSRASFVTNAAASRLPQALGGSSALQGLTAQLGIGSLNDPSESPNFYSRLITSDELRRRLARSRFADPRTPARADSAPLLDILGIKHRDQARRLEIALTRLERMIKVDVDATTNIVTIAAEAGWPDLSAAIANRTMELVNAFNREQRVSRARSKRTFLENRLSSAYDELRAAEEQQRVFYEQNRMWRNSPGLVFEEARHSRNVEVAGDLYLTLRQQFELARLDEFNDAALISIVDHAVAPRRPVWPDVGVLLIAAVFVGTIFGVVTAGALVIVEDWRRRNPDAAVFLADSLPARQLRARMRKRLHPRIAAS